MNSGAKGGAVRGFLLMLAAIGMFCVLPATQQAQGWQAPSYLSDESSAPRRLTGIVVDKSGQPVPNAIVYLENKRNLALYTYIAGDDGSYQFNNLSPDVDYEVHAEAGGRRSGVKTLSSFDSHKRARINLKLDKKKGD
jgi:hypothetical protein